MFARIAQTGLLAALVVAVSAAPADAFGRRSSSCCTTACCDPCWPWWHCCPPDTTPLNPLPHHPPIPIGTPASTLRLVNGTYSEAFAEIYIRHWDGCFYLYDRVPVPAGNNPVTLGARYYAGDCLLIKTWFRGTPTDHWHCHPNRLVQLAVPSGTFHLPTGTYTRP